MLLNSTLRKLKTRALLCSCHLGTELILFWTFKPLISWKITIGTQNGFSSILKFVERLNPCRYVQMTYAHLRNMKTIIRKIIAQELKMVFKIIYLSGKWKTNYTFCFDASISVLLRVLFPSTYSSTSV